MNTFIFFLIFVINLQTIYKQQKNIYRNIKRGGFSFRFSKNKNTDNAVDEKTELSLMSLETLNLSYNSINKEINNETIHVILEHLPESLEKLNLSDGMIHLSIALINLKIK